jgi:arginine exporter protein ArgO
MPSFVFDIILNIVLSIIFIYLMQYGWNYLKDTYTTKKTKDVVNTQIKKYKDMFEKLQASKQESSPFQTEDEKQSMNMELLEYVNQELALRTKR